MKTIQLNGSPVDLQAAASGKPPRFSMIAYNGGAMFPGGSVSGSKVIIDLSGLKVKGSRPIFLGHDSKRIVGHTTKIDVEAHRVVIEGVVSGTGEAANEVKASAKNGFPWKASVGADVQEVEDLRVGATATVNGRLVRGPIMIVRKSTLQESSFVPIAADDTTSVNVAAARAKRSNQTMAMSTAEKNELKQLREERRNGSLGKNRILAGLMVRAGIDPTPIGETHANFAFDQWGDQGLTLRAASPMIHRLQGTEGSGTDGRQINAAFSGATGVDIFDGLINSQMTQVFRESVDTTVQWVSSVQVDDFKTNRRMRRQQSERLAPVPRGQSADHINLDITQAEEYTVQRFGRQFVVDEQDLVSDDVDAIVSPAAVVAQGALGIKSSLIYSILLANAALVDAVALFDASTHVNLNTSAALTAATLDASIASMANQVENSHALDVQARYLLVPSELRGAAQRIARDMYQPDADDNIVVISEPRLSSGVTAVDGVTTYAGSTSTWYLAAHNAPTIEFGYIDPRPVVTSWELSMGQYGRGAMIKWDIGCKALDYRGLQENTA